MEVRDRRDHAAFHLNLSRTGPDVVPYRVGSRPAFLINHPDFARHVLDTHADRYENPYHPYRELAPFYVPAGAFALGLARGSRALHDELTRGLARTAAAAFEDAVGRTVHLDLLTKRLMFTATCEMLFGIDAADLADDFVNAVSFVEACWVNDPVPGYREALDVQNATADAIAGRIGAHDATTAIVRTLLNSYNATATALTWLLVVAGDDVSRPVVMETLRLYPPAWAIGRVAARGDYVGGTLIPPGSVVSVAPYTLHRDPRFWEHPSVFDPSRFAGARTNPAFLPFGAGARRCPAAALNIGHLEILLAAILRVARVEVLDAEAIRPRGLVALRPDPPVQARISAR